MNTQPHRKIFLAAASVLVFLSMELAAYWTLEFLESKGVTAKAQQFKLSQKHIDALKRLPENGFIGGVGQIDPDLGWALKPGAEREEIRINSQGLRSDKEYFGSPEPGKTRIAAFGDSFVFGLEVPYPQTWGQRLENSNPGLEVMNFGVPGYGTDQAFLRYRAEGARFRPQIVLIGFMTENISRNVNVFRPFLYYNENHVCRAKPRFKIVRNELISVPNPLPTLKAYNQLLQYGPLSWARLGKNDYFYSKHYGGSIYSFSHLFRACSILFEKVVPNSTQSPDIIQNGVLNPASEAFQVTAKIFEQFCAEASQNNSKPIILIFPNKDDVQRLKKNGYRSYRPLLDYLNQHQLPYLDLGDIFEKSIQNKPVDEFFAKFGHYSAAGNQLVAEEVARRLFPAAN